MLGFEELLDSDEIAGWQVCLAVVARVKGADRGGLGAGRRSCELQIGEGVGGGHASNRLWRHHRV